MIDVGDTIGEYRIVSKLSEGGMASLFLGRRTTGAPTDPPVAIKVIHENLSTDWQFVRMFVDEALISVRIRHPNVVRVDELGEQDNTYFLAMEYVHGCTLAELLRAMGRQGRRMRPEIAVWIASQVAAGLHAAHEMTGHDGQLLGVIHRDVSPQNVLLAIDGQVKLLDFGIAKAAGRAERTEAGVIKGKVRYMSPEQAAGQDLDRRVDIYALGVVLWEMLTMRRFIEGRTDIEIIRKVRQPDAVPPSFRAEGIIPAIDDAVMAALQPEPTRRPPHAVAFQRLLESAVPSGTVGPQHVAELLRVFVSNEIQQSARALPADIAAPIVSQAEAAKPLPGEDVTTTGRVTKEERTRTLTTQVPRISFEELTSDTEKDGDATPFAASIEPTRGAIPRHVSGGMPDAAELLEVEIDGLEEQPEPAGENLLDGLPRFGNDEDEHTVEASGHELADFLHRIRADAITAGKVSASPTGASPTGAAPATRANPIPPAPRRAPEASPPTPERVVAPTAQMAVTPAPVAFSQPTAPTPWPPPEAEAPPAPPAAAPSAVRWVLRVVVITMAAFVLGAGFAVAYVRYLR